MLECLSGCIEDEKNFYGKYQKYIPNSINRLIVCIIVNIFGMMYCCGAGFYILEIVDSFGTIIPLMMTCLVNCYFFSILKFIMKMFYKNLIFFYDNLIKLGTKILKN